MAHSSWQTRRVCLTSSRHLATYYFWYFAAVGVFEPYLAPFRRQMGFPPAQIGLLNSIMPGVAAFAPSLWTAAAFASATGTALYRTGTRRAVAGAPLASRYAPRSGSG